MAKDLGHGAGRLGLHVAKQGEAAQCDRGIKVTVQLVLDQRVADVLIEKPRKSSLDAFERCICAKI